MTGVPVLVRLFVAERHPYRFPFRNHLTGFQESHPSPNLIMAACSENHIDGSKTALPSIDSGCLHPNLRLGPRIMIRFN